MHEDRVPEAATAGLVKRAVPSIQQPFRYLVPMSRRASEDSGLAWLMEWLASVLGKRDMSAR